MSHPIDMAIASGAFKEGEIPASMSQYMSRIQMRTAYRAALEKMQLQQAAAGSQPIAAVSMASQPAEQSRMI